jgi:hypothetical protein
LPRASRVLLPHSLQTCHSLHTSSIPNAILMKYHKTCGVFLEILQFTGI